MVQAQITTLNQLTPILLAELPLLYGSTEKPVQSKVEPLDVNEAIKEIFKSSLKTTEQEQAEKPKEQMRE